MKKQKSLSKSSDSSTAISKADPPFIRALAEWVERPHTLGHLLGFPLLSEVHSEWVKIFLGTPKGGKRVLQAHRNSYKTTAGLVGLTLLYMLFPNLRVLIVRKTLKNAEKLVQAMQKIFQSDIVRAWMKSRHGLDSLLTDTWSAGFVTIACKRTITAEPSLQAAGIGTSITGSHFDIIWADDVVTDQDRYSPAERERTINYIYELDNIIEPEGSQFITGTVWHPKDAFSVLPEPYRFRIGEIEIKGITPAWIADRKKRTPVALWAANYELRHVKDINPEFGEVKYFKEIPRDVYWRLYVDPAFGGGDYVAACVGAKVDGVFLIRWGKLWSENIGDIYSEFKPLWRINECADGFCEANGAQILAVQGLNDAGVPVEEKKNVSNKHARITSVLKPVWDKVFFHESMITPQELTETEQVSFVSQVAEYVENADHDDAPDALAGLIESFEDSSMPAEDVLDILGRSSY